MSAPLIQVKDLVVSFPDGKGGMKCVVDKVSLNIAPGEMVALFGPSGCGKTTVLRQVLGSKHPTSGEVLIDNKEVQHVTRDVGIVFQKYSLFPHISVRENIAQGMLFEKTNLFQRTFRTPHFRKVKREANAFADQMISDIGLDPSDANKYPKELSGGMQQRVAIASALAMEPRPKVLLLDEPFSALDKRNRLNCQELVLREWEKWGLTGLFVTHDFAEGLRCATRIICLSQFWDHDDGRPGQGARVVWDTAAPLPPKGERIKPTSIFRDSEFLDLVETLEDRVLNKKKRWKVSDFVLTHPHAIKTAA
jgi:NitT/TauT family transport system ATP-binding protein